MSNASCDNLIINGIVPFLFTYSRAFNKISLQDYALELLEKLKPEQNHIIKSWKQAGWKSESAYTTQGLLQLYSNFCSAKKCLICSIGTKVLNHD